MLCPVFGQSLAVQLIHLLWFQECEHPVSLSVFHSVLYAYMYVCVYIVLYAYINYVYICVYMVS